MDEIVALVRTNQIKKRLAGVTALLDALKAQSEPLTTDADFLTSLLPDIAPCLRENNFKVAMTSLEILELLLASVADSAVRAQLKALWSGLVECLGDSKLQVREKAVDVCVMLAQILGVSVMFERLRPCVAHKNWRTREQTVHALWRCLEQLRLFNASVRNDVLNDTVGLLEDSAKEVRDSAMRALEKFYEHLGPALMYELENKKIRAGHMKTLTEKFSGGTTQARNEPTYSARSFAEPPRPVDTAPLSSTARFLSAIRNKEYDFNNIDSAVEAFSRPAQTSVPSVEKSPSQSSTASQSASVADAAVAADTDVRTMGGISDRDVQRELSKISDGLRRDNDWSVRVESLKNLQRLSHKCNHGGEGAISTLAQGIRPIREALNDQVSDLRSSVAREACQTVQTLANVLKDEFNPHAEHFMTNLMKATYITIHVISTASDTSLRGIVESTKNGYKGVIAKFIDGAKTRNQVLRLNCVTYLTLTLERWNVVFLSKHLDLFLQILPTLLHDADADVRAQARKCYWALHRLFPQETESLLERLDPSTRKNVRDDPAARENRSGGDQVSVSGTASTYSSSGRFTLRKENSSSRLMGGVTPELGLGSSTSSATSALATENAFSNAFSGAPSKVSASLSSSAPGGVGPRRVLGCSLIQGEATEPSRALPARVIGQGGAIRVGLASRVQNREDNSGDQGVGRSVAGPLRVLKAVERVEIPGGQNLPPVPRAQRIQVVTDTSPSNANFGESTQTTSGPVARKDRQNGPKRRAVTPEAESKADNELGLENSFRPRSESEAQAPRSSASSREQALPPKTARPTLAVPAPSSDDGYGEALARLEDGSWKVRVDAFETIDRRLQKSGPPSTECATSAKEKKMDERVLQALIYHLTDGHYRVVQAALKTLQSCLRIVHQQQVVPYLKSMLPKLFQKFVDSKTQVAARENLELLVCKYDATLLVGHVIQQLADGSNAKMKAAVCHYLKELLPGSHEYFQQSANNAQMRGLLTKIVQLLEGDVPVATSASCAKVIQVACALYPAEVESAMPLLAPSKRSTLSRVLREKGIVLSLTQGVNSNVPPPQASSAAPSLDNQCPPPPPAEPAEQVPRSRKRHAQSPSKFAPSPITTSRKELEVGVVTPVSDKGTARQHGSSVLDYESLSSLSEFASMLSSASMKSPEEQFEDLLLIVADNNSGESDKAAAYHKMGGFIKSEPDRFWEKYFPRVLSVLLEAASERDANAVRILQRFVRGQPHRAEEFFHPILIGLLDSINGCVDLAAHLAGLTLTDIVRASTKTDRVLDLLMPLIESRDPPALQVVLQLVRSVLERAADQGVSSKSSILLRSTEWNARLLALLVAKLQHSSSDVRKRAVDCLVAYYFATNEDAQLSAYLAEHVDVTKQRLVDIFIQRKKADRERASPMDVSA